MSKQKILFSLVLLLSLLVGALSALQSWTGLSAIGSQSKQPRLEIAGLHGNVTIQRDERNIPYIEATNEEDLYFAQGYSVASDRLWQMDLLRRTAAGELSEIFGSRMLQEDKRRRAFGFAVVAEQMLQKLSPPARAQLEAYARGVNAYITSQIRTNLPSEFRLLRYEPRLWSPADSLIIGKLLAETLSSTWQTDMMRAAFANVPPERVDELLPSTSPLDLILIGSDKVDKKRMPLSAPSSRKVSLEMLGEISEMTMTLRRSLERVGIYAEDLAASNNWVVNGRRSLTGKPLLANDPHLQPSAPSIWYMAHLAAPGLRVAGVTVPGNPGIFIGHNDWIAWGITNVEADVQDIYLEKFDNADTRRYLTPKGWREAEVRREKIKVRKNLISTDVETVEFDVTITRHGPILIERDGLRYAVAWTAFDPTANEFEACYKINRARDWQGFTDALSGYTGFPLNFVYADVSGHIGYWAAGRYPIRKTGSGIVPYDGATDAGDWTGYIPFNATPHIYNPPSGVIVTANNRVVGADYPYYITNNWAAPYRARRIYDLLTSKPKLSIEDFRAIQSDAYSYPDAIFGAEIIKLGRPLAESSPEWREILAIFEQGQPLMNPESRTIVISAVMRDAFQRRILAGALGDELAGKYSWSNIGTLCDRMITTQPREWLPQGFDSYQALLLACYRDAQKFITERIGAEKSQWSWGNIQQVRFHHPLANVPLLGRKFEISPIPQTGGNSAVNRGALVSMRFLADLNDWDNTRQGITLGQSGDPSSPHWNDQLESWRSAAPPIFPFSKNAVANAAKGTLLLTAPARQLDR